MEQLLCHLVGDYVLQTDYMASNKRKNLVVAFYHAFVYSLPFVLLGPSFTAWAFIFFSHAIIDHFALARYVIYYYNYVFGAISLDLTWEDCNATGFSPDKPAWLAVWLLIIVDNTMHLVINYLALTHC